MLYAAIFPSFNIILAVQAIHAGVLGLTISVALQEYFLMALSQPRTEVESSSSDEEGEVEADQELEQLDSPAARMYRKSMVFQQDQKKIREEVIKHKRSAFSIPVCCCAPELAQESRVLSQFEFFMLALVLALPYWSTGCQMLCSFLNSFAFDAAFLAPPPPSPTPPSQQLWFEQ